MYVIEQKLIGTGAQLIALPLGSTLVGAHGNGRDIVVVYRRPAGIAPTYEHHRVLAVPCGETFDTAPDEPFRLLGIDHFIRADGEPVYVFEIGAPQG